MVAFARLTVLAALILPPPAPAADQTDGRRFRIDDLFRLEAFGELGSGGYTNLHPFEFSLDGESLTYTRLRPREFYSSNGVLSAGIEGHMAGDVWVQERFTSEPRKITSGTPADAVWWGGRWSKSGTRLALLSARAGKVTLWSWDKASGDLRQLSPLPVDAAATFVPQQWVDDARLLCPLQNDAGDTWWLGSKDERQAMGLAKKQWARAGTGRSAAVSVLDTRAHAEPEPANGALYMIDVRDGKTTFIGPTRDTAGLSIAPGGRWVAYARRIGTQPVAVTAPLALLERKRYRLEIHPLNRQGRTLVAPLDDVVPESIRWSPSGAQVAWLVAPSHAGTPLLYRLNVETGELYQGSLSGLQVISADASVRCGLEFFGHDSVVVWAAGSDVLGARRDWWLIPHQGSARNLTGSLPAAPAELWRVGPDELVGYINGALWRLSPDSPVAARLLPNLVFDELIWPKRRSASTAVAKDPLPATSIANVVVARRHFAARKYLVLNLQNGSAELIKPPADDAVLKDFSPQSGAALFSRSDSRGLKLWRTSLRTTQPRELVSTNHFLQKIRPAEARMIEYQSLDGQSLKGWIFLPPGHRPGRRYPLITWIYAGLSYSADRPLLASVMNEFNPLNRQIPPAHDFAVLLPSMPLEKEGSGIADDPISRLADGVLPAVDRAIEMGFADASRLFLMGQSYGGYSTYGLITQTRRFAAAAALAGFTDLASLYGTFDVRARYTDQAHSDMTQARLLESGQLRMGSPPWRDIARYWRNSPISYVDRVETPLLIIHGDLDFVPIEQAEAFFTGLYRQQKPAQFVRYWGEGHLFNSPANICDMWFRIFAWFDEWGDIARDTEGDVLWDGNRVQSRNGKPALQPGDYDECHVFRPDGDAVNRQ